jgi:hypothetical protein
MLVCSGDSSLATTVDDTLPFDLVIGDFSRDEGVPAGLHAALLHAPCGVSMTVVINPELAFGSAGVPTLGV